MTPARREVRHSQVTLTTVFTVCAGVLLVVGAVMFVTHSLLALTLSVSALMIAVALDHAVSFLQRRRLPRSLGIVIVAVTALAAVVGIAFLVVPPAVAQGKALYKNAPKLLRQAQSTRLYRKIDQEFHVGNQIEDLPDKALQMVGGAAGPVLSFVGGVLNVVAALVTIVFLAVFMLVFGGRLVEGLLAESLPERRERYRKLVDKVYDLIGGYLGGLMLICTINATATTTTLAILGIPFFLPLGLLSGFSSLVPYAGPLVAGTSISLLATAMGGPWKGLGCVIYFVAYGQVEGNLLSPFIFRRTVHVNPLVVTLSILFFGEIAGVIGAILAVPITAALQIVLRELLRDRRERLHLPRTAMNTPSDST